MASILITSGTGYEGAHNFSSPGVVLSTGRLVVPVDHNGTLTFHYSDDNGQTWGTLTGTKSIGTFNPHTFGIQVDTNDDLIICWTGSGTGVLLDSGSISGTTITWRGDDVSMRPGTAYGPYGFTALRIGTVVYAFAHVWDAIAEQFHIQRTTKTDGGGWTAASSEEFIQAIAFYPQSGALTFAHTGDGITASASPHLFGAWRPPSSTQAIWYKLPYTGGGTWGAETGGSPDSSLPASGTPIYGAGIVFDGTRLMMTHPHTASPYVRVWERDGSAWSSDVARHPAALPGATGAAYYTNITADVSTGDFIVFAQQRPADGSKVYSNYYSRQSGAYQGWTEWFDDTDQAVSMSVIRPQRGLSRAGLIYADDATPTNIYYIEADNWRSLGGGWGRIPIGG